MSSREEILAKILANQPEATEMVVVPAPVPNRENLLERLTAVLGKIGGEVITAENLDEINRRYSDADLRVITPLTELARNKIELLQNTIIPHELANVDVAIIKGHFAVAENGAVWVTEPLMGSRALPYICQHLAIVIDARDIVATMVEAYEKIGDTDYDFGSFIAGPSKTADIEQSLVVGAHGARTLTLYVMANK